MYVIVGLGNPGTKYENTRHNVGFLTIDRLAEKLGIDVRTLKWKALVGEGRYLGEKILLVKPQTFMNSSGESVAQIVNFYKTSPRELIVIQDDIDIAFGHVRVKRRGSAGTHNGMKSIIQLLADDDFTRVKIAVGKRPPQMDLAAFVLSHFTTEEIPVMRAEIDCARDAVLTVIRDGLDAAMNQTNGWSALPEDKEK